MRDIHFPGRSPVYGKNAMVSSSHPSASLTAIETLKKGGNAVDAAVAAAAVLSVVEAHSTGIGGDLFCLYCPFGSKQPIAINGSGKTPEALDVEKIRTLEDGSIDPYSPEAITIPGAIAAWDLLLKDHGKLSFNEVLSPAIKFAEEGYVVADVIADMWARENQKLNRDDDCKSIFLKNGASFQAGDVHYQKKLAETLKIIASEGRDGFYKGKVAEDMVSKIKSIGGLHTLKDFEEVEVEYVEPISTMYRGNKIFECPPNGQGLIALMILNILSGYDLKALDPFGAERIHLESEATKLAFYERNKYLADPNFYNIPVSNLISEEYADLMRKSISKENIITNIPNLILPEHKDTVYLCVVDNEGNCISFINSIFQPFGSGIVSNKSGVLFHNRGASFSLDKKNPNFIEPKKRPMHTIIPGMMFKDDLPIMPFGVMGAHYQPVGQAHFITNCIDYNMDVQKALDNPRTFYFNEKLSCERSISEKTLAKLREIGHDIDICDLPHGGGQAIKIDRKNNILIGGSDFRKDGASIGY